MSATMNAATSTTSDDSPKEMEDTLLKVEEFVSNILTPGSSLNPTFLLILDCALFLLLFVFVGCLVLTRSLHFVALLVIEMGLWASVKWYVAELKREDEIIALEKEHALHDEGVHTQTGGEQANGKKSKDD